MRRLRFIFTAVALFIVISCVFSSIGFALPMDYYLSGTVVYTDRSMYSCGDEVKTLATLYFGNVTVPNFPVRLQITSPSGVVLFSSSVLTDNHGVARGSLLLSPVCDLGVYTVTATSRGNYNSVNANNIFSVSRENYVTIGFDKIWYGLSDSVDITGRLVTNCSLAVNQEIQMVVFGPDGTLLGSASTPAVGLGFAFVFKLSGSTGAGLYQVTVHALDPCQNRQVYANVSFPVLSNTSLQPWGIFIALDKTTYVVGDAVKMSAIVSGGQYFSCQLGFTCRANGTLQPVNFSFHLVSANGTEVYLRKKSIGLDYYPPVYGFEDVFSGYVQGQYLKPGKYIVIVEVSSEGFPTVEAFSWIRVISPLADFSISVSPSMFSMFPSSTYSTKLTVSPQFGFDSDVDLSVSWVGHEPANVTTILYPIVNSTESRWVSNLTLSAGPYAPTGGVFNLTVTGRQFSKPDRSHSVRVMVQFTSCFIATATYGSPSAAQVSLLREFRDNVLLKTFAGSSFLIGFNSWYYSFSPQVASVIVNNDALRFTMAIVLFPLLQVLSFSTRLFFELGSTGAEFAIIFTGLVASMILSATYFTLPIALLLKSCSRTLRRRLRRLMLIELATCSCSILAGELVASSWIMMFATSFFLLSTMGCVAVCLAELLLDHASLKARSL